MSRYVKHCMALITGSSLQLVSAAAADDDNDEEYYDVLLVIIVIHIYSLWSFLLSFSLPLPPSLPRSLSLSLSIALSGHWYCVWTSEIRIYASNFWEAQAHKNVANTLRSAVMNDSVWLVFIFLRDCACKSWPSSSKSQSRKSMKIMLERPSALLLALGVAVVALDGLKAGPD